MEFGRCPTGGQVVAGSNPVSPTIGQRMLLLTMGRVAASQLVDLIHITTEDDVFEFTNS
jgi:hypothetical protein